MLGLGSTIVSGQGLGYTLVNTFTSDFTGGSVAGSGTGDATSSDGSVWESDSVEGNLTKTLNATVDGSAGWLKCVYDTNQTGSSGIQSNLGNFAMKIGDFQIVSFKLYIGGSWDGVDEVQIGTSMQNTTYGVELKSSSDSSATRYHSTFQVSQGETVTVSGHTNPPNYNNTMFELFANASGDLPQDTAYIAIKDLVIKTYRRTG